MHRTTARFWTLLVRLPEPIQRVAHQNFELLKENPAHPSLHFKKVGNFWSARGARPFVVNWGRPPRCIGALLAKLLVCRVPPRRSPGDVTGRW
jgi:hypothetical protein